MESERRSMAESGKRNHTYNAVAKVLEGNLRLPLTQTVHPHAHLQIDPAGGYEAVHTRNHRTEGVLSYDSAYSQVAGNPSSKPGEGWTTLSTTVVEGLNILEVVTADRVVGQIITVYPLEGYVPTISFLGTRFENLRIAGNPLELDLDLNVLGEAPKKDGPYTKDEEVISRISGQHKRILSHNTLPVELGERYNQLSARLGSREALECSLVNEAKGSFPGQSFGHVITIPHFGTITLAKLIVEHEDFHEETGAPKKTTVRLTMLDCKLGCAIEGTLAISGPVTNGTTKP
jgi:hypothetical protein